MDKQGAVLRGWEVFLLVASPQAIGTLYVIVASPAPSPTTWAYKTRTILMKPTDTDIEVVIREALTRYDAGRLQHGQLDLAQDSRDYIEEAIQELLDCINYCVFQILRLRSIKD